MNLIKKTYVSYFLLSFLFFFMPKKEPKTARRLFAYRLMRSLTLSLNALRKKEPYLMQCYLVTIWLLSNNLGDKNVLLYKWLVLIYNQLKTGKQIVISLFQLIFNRSYCAIMVSQYLFQLCNNFRVLLCNIIFFGRIMVKVK